MRNAPENRIWTYARGQRPWRALLHQARSTTLLAKEDLVHHHLRQASGILQAEQWVRDFHDI